MASLPKTMKAVGLYKYLPISDVNSLIDLQVSLPEIKKTDVLLQVKAIGMNPFDAKQRAPKPTIETSPRILGCDGAGVVVDKGERVTKFKLGDEVFFTGDIRRSGTNAEYIALEEITVGNKPKNLTFEQAAAMPVTGLTAYETIYDRLQLSEKDKGKSLLIINSAGGVGAVASQIAKNLGLKVIGTASRPESEAYTRQHGADIVLNHSKDLLPQLEAHSYIDKVDYILVNYDPKPYWDMMMKAIKPQGKIALIVESSGLFDLTPLKLKSITLVSERIFTRQLYNTEDKYRTHDILQKVSQMLENGQLNCTLTKTLSPINAANLREAHRILEENKMLGKLVLSGF